MSRSPKGFTTPRTTGLQSTAAYRANGRKPLFDAATCARIRRRRDEDGLSLTELAQMYDVSTTTIRAAIRRDEFGGGNG